MEIRTFGQRLTAASAVERSRRYTLTAYAAEAIKPLFGGRRDSHTGTVSQVYYPVYLAFTTVTLHRYLRGDVTVRFLAGVDGVTGRVGEIDVDLPDHRTKDIAPEAAIGTDLDERDAETAWRDWLFTYLDRKYRPVKRPDSSLDDLDLVHVRYWIVDNGTSEDSFAINDLTRQADRVEDVRGIAEYYEMATARSSRQ